MSSVSNDLSGTGYGGVDEVLLKLSSSIVTQSLFFKKLLKMNITGKGGRDFCESYLRPIFIIACLYTEVFYIRLLIIIALFYQAIIFEKVDIWEASTSRAQAVPCLWSS